MVMVTQPFCYKRVNIHSANESTVDPEPLHLTQGIHFKWRLALGMQRMEQSHIRYRPMTQPWGSLLDAYLPWNLFRLRPLFTTGTVWVLSLQKASRLLFSKASSLQRHTFQEGDSPSTLDVAASCQIPGPLPGQPLLLVSSHFLHSTVIKRLH